MSNGALSERTLPWTRTFVDGVCPLVPTTMPPCALDLCLFTFPSTRLSSTFVSLAPDSAIPSPERGGSPPGLPGQRLLFLVVVLCAMVQFPDGPGASPSARIPAQLLRAVFSETLPPSALRRNIPIPFPSARLPLTTAFACGESPT